MAIFIRLFLCADKDSHSRSDKDKMLTMWLADKVCNILGNEECAIGALELAKDQKRNE